MTKDEALKMAIKELKKLADDLDEKLWKKINKFEEALDQPALTDEKGRPMTYWGGLEQPAQEPVAWKAVALRLGENLALVGPDNYYSFSPFEWLDWALKHTHPHQWQVLTEDEIKELLASVGWIFPDSIKTTDSDYSLKAVLEAYKKIISAIRAIEQALRSKNSWLD
jgi:hypothetical protein